MHPNVCVYEPSVLSENDVSSPGKRERESDRGVVRGRQWNRLKDWGRVSKEITDNN